MTPSFSLKAVQMDVLLRALAISHVAYHHAYFLAPPDDGLWLAGGMAFLLMLSGMNLARFSIDRASPDQLRSSIAAYARRVFIPSVLAVLFSFLVRRQFSWEELLFYQNLITPSGVISLFPVFYVQVLLQLLVVLYLLVLVPRVAIWVIRYPGRSALALFLVGMLARWLGPAVFGNDPPFLEPHLFLWDFALGLVVYYFGRGVTAPPSPPRRLLALLCVVSAAAFMFSPVGLRFWWLLVGGTFLIFVRDVRIPAIMARVATIVSGAAFAIFLTHMFWFEVYATLHGLFVSRTVRPSAPLVFAFGMLMSVGGWVAYTAFVRAYHRLPAPATAV
jgi:peptidoglycan/LPS O-acetylase OafA/YrhL